MVYFSCGSDFVEWFRRVFMTRNKLIVLAAIVLAAVLAVVGIWIFKDGKEDGAYLDPMSSVEYVKEACVIEALDDGRLFVYTDSLYFIPTEKAEFVSHDETVKSVSDIKEGMVIQFTATDFIMDLTFPSSYNHVTKIETWGKVDTETYEKGSKLWQDWCDRTNSLIEEAEKQRAGIAD